MLGNNYNNSELIRKPLRFEKKTFFQPQDAWNRYDKIEEKEWMQLLKCWRKNLKKYDFQKCLANGPDSTKSGISKMDGMTYVKWCMERKKREFQVWILFHFTVSLLDNAPNQVVGCIMKKRMYIHYNAIS